MTTLSIIILSYNTADLTLKCLKSIQDQYQKKLKSGEFEIIVADNASTDGSVEAIRNFQFSIFNFQSNSNIKTKNFQIIKNEKNYGFSKGNNFGAKEARGKYLLFLNSDTEIQDRGLLEMINYLDENENVGVLGAKLLNQDGSSQRSAGKFYNILNVFLMLFGGEKIASIRFSPKIIKEVDWVSGAALMIKKGIFYKLNGFDEKIFMYMEDMELCFRVKRSGFKTVFYPNITILHKELGSSNRKFAIINIYKNLLYFYDKHKNFLEYTLIKVLLYLKAILAIVIGIITHNSYLTLTYKKAIGF